MNTQSKLLKENYRGYRVYAYGELSDDKSNVVVNKQHSNPTNNELEYIEASYGKKFSGSAFILSPSDGKWEESEIIKACKNRFKHQTIKSSDANFLTMPMGEAILKYLIDKAKKHIDSITPEKVCLCNGESSCQGNKKEVDDALNTVCFCNKYAKVDFKNGNSAIAYNCRKTKEGWECDWIKWVSHNKIKTVSPDIIYNENISGIREATDAEVEYMKDTEYKMLEETKKLEEESKKMFDFDNLSLFPFWSW